MPPRFDRPSPAEHAPYAGVYVAAVGGANVLALLDRQRNDVASFFHSLPAGRADYAYAPGKWTMKEVLGHLCDCERVFSYRALRAARRDPTPLPPFDENQWMAHAGFRERAVNDLLGEFDAVRGATLALLRHLPSDGPTRRCIANGQEVSVRALAYITAGHVEHHLEVLRERYL